MPAQPKTVKYLTSSDGATIYADAIGNPDGRSIVFVHGKGCSAAAFDNIFEAEQYSKDYFLVSVLISLILLLTWLLPSAGSL